MNGQDLDLEWFKENREALFKKYPHQFVVINNKEVAYASLSFKDALEYARKSFGMGNFLVQQIEECEIVHHLYNHHIA